MANSKILALALFVVSFMIFICLFMGSRVFCGFRPAASNAILVIENARFRCKPVLQGDKAVSDRIEVKNIGTSPLVIGSIDTECKCLIAGLQLPCKIKPGKSMDFNVELDTSDYSGVFESKVLIRSNAANAPEQVITLEFAVTPGLISAPKAVKMGLVDMSEGLAEFEITITVKDPYRTEHLDVHHLPHGLVVKNRVVLPTERSVIYIFAVESGYSQVVIDDKIGFVVHRGETQTKLWVRVSCKAFMDYVVDPYPLSVGSLSHCSSKKAGCSIAFKEEVTHLAVLASHSNTSGNSVKIEEINISKRDNLRYDVSCTVYGNKRGVYNDVITLSYVTEGGDTRRLKIPLLGTVY